MFANFAEKEWIVRLMLSRELNAERVARRNLIVNLKLDTSQHRFSKDDKELAAIIREGRIMPAWMETDKHNLKAAIIMICQEFRFDHDTIDRIVLNILLGLPGE